MSPVSRSGICSRLTWRSLRKGADVGMYAHMCHQSHISTGKKGGNFSQFLWCTRPHRCFPPPKKKLPREIFEDCQPPVRTSLWFLAVAAWLG